MTGRQLSSQAGRQAGRQASRQASRQAGRQADRKQAGRPTGSQIAMQKLSPNGRKLTEEVRRHYYTYVVELGTPGNVCANE